MTYNEIKAAWNAQADERNHWDNLSGDEKIEWAFDCGADLSMATPDLMKALKLIANAENSALDLAYCKGIARAAIANAQDGIQRAMQEDGVEEEDDSEYDCPHCGGTGEGQYDGQTCSVCRGKGVCPK